MIALHIDLPQGTMKLEARATVHVPRPPEEVFDFVTATIQSFWQCTPLAAVLGDKEDRVDHVEILVRDVAALQRQVRLDARVLLCRDFDPRGLTFSVNTHALEYSKPRPIV